MVVNGQLSYLLSRDNESILPTANVKTVTVDQYCINNNITVVRVIKCDVEGFELFVLQGAQQVLRLQKPALVLEIEERLTKRYGYTPNDACTFLEEFGYSGKPILNDTPIGNGAQIDEKAFISNNPYLFEVKE